MKNMNKCLYVLIHLCVYLFGACSCIYLLIYTNGSLLDLDRSDARTSFSVRFKKLSQNSVKFFLLFFFSELLNDGKS